MVVMETIHFNIPEAMKLRTKGMVLWVPLDEINVEELVNLKAKNSPVANKKA